MRISALIAASAAAMALAAAASERGLSHREREEIERDRKRKAAPPAPPPPANLPGETNRQFAARMKAAPQPRSDKEANPHQEGR